MISLLVITVSVSVTRGSVTETMTVAMDQMKLKATVVRESTFMHDSIYHQACPSSGIVSKVVLSGTQWILHSLVSLTIARVLPRQLLRQSG